MIKNRICIFYRQSCDTIIRSIGKYGYIYSQITIHDRTYIREGRAFWKFFREFQSHETLAIRCCEYFVQVTPADIQNNLKEFLDIDRWLQAKIERKSRGKMQIYCFGEFYLRNNG